ncbi:MAG: FAD/NAD(P)-binding oxidoreductase [Rhodobacter sp.]|nr:FAD/NAD(P)-binding oxidoreductase [Rhodobacter sp.]
MTSTRREFFGLAAGAAALSAVTPAQAQMVKTAAKIVILGAGAAGTALANRLVRRLDGAQITIVDGSKDHWYQPGFSLVAAGLKPPSYTVSQTTDWLPSGVTLKRDFAANIDPEAKKVALQGGETLDYDFLVVATGLVLDYGAIEGFEMDLIGKGGVGSLYAGPDYAAKTWEAAGKFAEEGGVGLFTRPGTEMKCAGAPIKHTFLIDDIARRMGGRSKSEITYFANSKSLFGVPIVAERIRMVMDDRGINYQYQHVVQAIDPGAKKVTFTTPDGDYDLDYDYVHIIPPQRAPAVVRESGLSWANKWEDQGWVEVDKHTLRHNRYPEVFAVGDVAGVPKGKTAASVKWQVPVVEDHLVAQMADQAPTESYNGYTSCPLITRVGRAMLIEFDYDNNLVPSFPGIIAPLEELWISWLMKEVALKATYNAMLRGKA